ncbi:mechanosensitive ion channel family protein [Aquimonas voraii]|uniref:Small-conductance mechanosensitive channel n=1 Tax=Aquimonas voraii TaxID=265719 RepID=A0A1G6YVY4_9GAMM|nr:mechanosensitive ion channel domain-containing protein [Aquimonas voraii]SDD94461.1 Small-conductance mechanosensitive channel [Aquimonas voraii]
MQELIKAGSGIDWVGLATFWGLKISAALAIVLVGLWLARRLSNALRRLLERARVEGILANFFGNLAHAAVLVLVLITALDALGVPPTSLLAVMGAAGLAVGLAMKDSLSNIAAGVMLIVLRPFRTGDAVEIAGITGVVEQVRLFQTVLRSFQNHEITLPNGQITASPIINFTAKPQRRVDIPVGVDYGNDIRGAREVLLGFAKAHPSVLTEPAPDVVVDALADSSVNLVLRAWVNTPDFAQTRSDLLEAIHRGLPEAGYSIPFPQTDMHLHLPESVARLLQPRQGESRGATRMPDEA